MSTDPLVKTGRALSTAETTRYARHVLLPDVGRDGQERLDAARVLVVGAGGLGSPALLYLAAAGVGTIGVVDADVVDLTNLHRQVIHSDADIGRPKTESAEAAVHRVNPHVTVERHDVALDSSNALEIIAGYDLVVDGTDNFPTRYLVNDACVMLGKPHVWGSILRFDGQVSVWWAGHGPCYRCVFPEPPAVFSRRVMLRCSTVNRSWKSKLLSPANERTKWPSSSGRLPGLRVGASTTGCSVARLPVELRRVVLFLHIQPAQLRRLHRAARDRGRQGRQERFGSQAAAIAVVEEVTEASVPCRCDPNGTLATSW